MTRKYYIHVEHTKSDGGHDYDLVIGRETAASTHSDEELPLYVALAALLRLATGE